MIVGEPKWVFSIGEGGMVPLLVWTQVGTTLNDFVTLWLIRACTLRPLEASVLGSKTSSPEGKSIV